MNAAQEPIGPAAGSPLGAIDRAIGGEVHPVGVTVIHRCRTTTPIHHSVVREGGKPRSGGGGKRGSGGRRLDEASHTRLEIKLTLEVGVGRVLEAHATLGKQLDEDLDELAVEL